MKTEFEVVNETANKIFEILNNSKLSGMTIYYMMKDIVLNIENQLRAPVEEVENETEN